MCNLYTFIDSLCCKNTLPIGRWLECEEMLEIRMETDESTLILTDFFDAEGVARASHDLLIIEALDFVMRGFED